MTPPTRIDSTSRDFKELSAGIFNWQFDLTELSCLYANWSLQLRFRKSTWVAWSPEASLWQILKQPDWSQVSMKIQKKGKTQIVVDSSQIPTGLHFNWLLGLATRSKVNLQGRSYRGTLQSQGRAQPQEYGLRICHYSWEKELGELRTEIRSWRNSYWVMQWNWHQDGDSWAKQDKNCSQPLGDIPLKSRHSSQKRRSWNGWISLWVGRMMLNTTLSGTVQTFFDLSPEGIS